MPNTRQYLTELDGYSFDGLCRRGKKHAGVVGDSIRILRVLKVGRVQPLPYQQLSLSLVVLHLKLRVALNWVLHSYF
jgi:hypothetical protein